jgi:predicted transposase YdaD
MAKSKKHDKIVKDFDRQKSEHLDKLATQMLKNDEKMQKLKDKRINPNFLKLF